MKAMSRTGSTRLRLFTPRWWKVVGWRHVVGIVMTVIAVFPLVYVVSTSLARSGTLSGSNAIFSSFTLDNFRGLFADPQRPFARWLLNTVVLGSVTAVLSVLLCAAAAYGFAYFAFRGRRVGLGALVVTQMFPQFLSVVAIFLMLERIGDAMPSLGLGSIAGLVAIYLGGALGVNAYLMYGYFNTLPRELFEAARVDGAGHAFVFFRIVLPLVRPILVVVGMLVYIAAAGDFVIASVALVEPEQQTAAVGLYNMLSLFRNDRWGAFCAGAVITAVPVMALFIYAQKHIVNGLFAGSVK